MANLIQSDKKINKKNGYFLQVSVFFMSEGKTVPE